MTRHSFAARKVDSFDGRLSKKELEDFVESYGLKKNTIKVYECDKDYFACDGTCYSTKNGRPVQFRGTYRHNDVEDETGIPDYDNISQQKTPDGDGVLTYKTNHMTGEFVVAVLTNRDGQNTVECVKTKKGYFATIRIEDYDLDAWNEPLVFDLVDEDDLPREAGNNDVQRKIVEIETEECAEYDQIDVAIVYESSFCKRKGNSKETADQEAMYLVELASQRYQQNGLCLKLNMSHLEGYCDVEIDPFEKKENSGCGNENDGLLDEFEVHWKNKDLEVERDVAQLFTGMKMNDSVVGCAKARATCDKTKAYGVSQAAKIWNSQTDPYVFRSTLVAHELGHNNGVGASEHDEKEDYIMYGDILTASKGFSAESIGLMRNYLENKDCLEHVVPAPTAAPTAASVPCRWPFFTLLRFGPLPILFCLLIGRYRRRCSSDDDSGNTETTMIPGTPRRRRETR